MRLEIIAIGKMKAGPLKNLFEEYLKRLTCSFSLRELEVKTKGAPENIKLLEQELILGALPKDASIFVLDERGVNLSSEDMAHLIRDAPQGHTAFVIGGADGLTPLIRSNADKIIAFGSQTWPHMMIRIMLMEQLYRAQQILKNHPYHRH